MNLAELTPGARIRVAQTIHYRDRSWDTQVEGVIKSVRSESTGSWFAHGKNDKLWLYRLDLQKDDGELTKLVLDARSRITLLPAAPKETTK